MEKCPSEESVLRKMWRGMINGTSIPDLDEYNNLKCAGKRNQANFNFSYILKHTC
jgi:hypothetical protein